MRIWRRSGNPAVLPLQGAIDMVQMEQQRVDPAAARRQLKQYRQYYHSPKRIAAAVDADGVPAVPSSL